MTKRIFSTCLLWGGLVFILTQWQAMGGFWLITALALLTQLEFYQLLKKSGKRVLVPTGLALGAFLCIAAWYEPYPFGLTASALLSSAVYLGIAGITLLIGLLGIYIILRGYRKRGPSPFVPTLWGIFYVPFMLQFYIRLIHVYTERGDPVAGVWLVVWVIAVAKFTDVGGLLTGLALGQHKMAPSISPKKTWEGAGGGVLFAVILGVGISYFGERYLPASFTVTKALFCALPISILSILSDLLQSVVKRRAKAKDSGSIIPGIGGVFDLTDSLILVAPVGFLLLHTL